MLRLTNKKWVRVTSPACWIYTMNASCSASTGESAANSHLPVSLRSREGAASGLTLQYEPKVNPVVLTAAHTYTHH